MVELSETFYVFIVATSSALIGLILKLCYDSKCTNIDLFCLKIKRDTAGEIDEDKFKIEHGIRPKEVEIPIFQDANNEV
jgi:hypothetical protein